MSLPVENDRQLVTPDGTAVVIRAVTPRDDRRLSELYNSLPADEWVCHLGVKDGHNGGAAARVATIAARGGRGLLATLPAAGPRGEVMLGEAHYELLPSGDGEATLVVSPAWRDWLGPRLFDAIVDEAAAAGLVNLEVEVMRGDTWMRHLVESRGSALVPTDEWLTTRLIVGTNGQTPLWGSRPQPRVLVEAPGRQWHAADAAREHGLTVMVCAGPGARGTRCPASEGLPCPLAAGADVVVVSYPPEGREWDDLLASHVQLHPEVPVVVESHTTRPVPEGVVILDVHDPEAVVRRITALARAPAARD